MHGLIQKKEFVMDYKKIGSFIASRRKEKNLTQAKLAKKLYVSEKTVSKWENGNGLPDTAILTSLCEILEVNLNELLSGEKLTDEVYKTTAEDNIANLLAERKTNKQKIAFSVVCFLVCFSVLLVCVLLTGYVLMPTWLRICLVVYGFIVTIFGLGVAIYYDIKAGSFECRHCGTKFTPSTSAYILGMHSATTRFLKCPHCGKRSFCKKRLTK